jgi:hypothetical protein
MIQAMELFDQLAQSEEYNDFVETFGKATGQPLCLESFSSWTLTGPAKHQANGEHFAPVPVRAGDKIVGIFCVRGERDPRKSFSSL